MFPLWYMPEFIDPLCVCTGMQEKHLDCARIEIKLYHLGNKMHVFLIPQRTGKPKRIHMCNKRILLEVSSGCFFFFSSLKVLENRKHFLEVTWQSMLIFSLPHTEKKMQTYPSVTTGVNAAMSMAHFNSEMIIFLLSLSRYIAS